jgi:drug/metabolite transporter (DMT)-like permease
MPALLLIFACALWGLSFPLVKALHLEQSARLPEASSLFLASWMQAARFGMAALLLAPFLIGRKRPTGSEVRQGLEVGLWGGLGMWLQADALAHTDASTSAFLTQAYCILLPLWACLKLRKSPGRRVIAATVMVLAGGGMLSGVRFDRMDMGRGELETLAAAVLFTFQILALERPGYAANRGLMASFVMFAGIAAMFVPIALAGAPRPGDMIAAGASWPALGLIGSLALFCSAGAYVIMNAWQRRVPATEAGLIYTSEPVFTAAAYVTFLPAMLGAAVGARYPNESLTPVLIAGGELIVAANVLMQWQRPPHLAGAPPAPGNPAA